MHDSDLVQGLREQDSRAVQHLTECYLPTIWRFVLAQVRGDCHLAEDIVSETVLALVRAAKGEFEVQSVVAWLRTVAANKIRDHFRAVARVQHLLNQASHAIESKKDEPTVTQESRERQHEVRAILDGLPEQHRLALEWKYIEQLTVREIADRFSTTEKAVESTLFRARQAFRQAIESRQRREAARSPAPNGAGPRQEPWNFVKSHAASEPEGMEGHAIEHH